MIQDKKITIAAGEEVPVQGVGTFIGVLDVSDTTQELRVSATNKDGQTILSARMLQGERVTLDRPFNQLRVKNEGVEAVDVLLLVGSGSFESGRLTGSVALENSVAVNELAGSRIEEVGAIDPVNIGEYSELFFDTNTVGLLTVLEPSANVAGLVVRRAVMVMGDARLMIAPIAPASADEPNAKTLSLARVITGAAGVVNDSCITVPAGWGVYLWVWSTASRARGFFSYKEA